jgi:hypothetical protein
LYPGLEILFKNASGNSVLSSLDSSEESSSSDLLNMRAINFPNSKIGKNNTLRIHKYGESLIFLIKSAESELIIL